MTKRISDSPAKRIGELEVGYKECIEDLEFLTIWTAANSSPESLKDNLAETIAHHWAILNQGG
jgi:hypothetical protein